MFLVVGAVFSGEGAVEEVAAVELYAGLGGGEGELASCGWVVYGGGDVAGDGPVEDEVVVVSAGYVVDAFADGVESAEV